MLRCMVLVAMIAVLLAGAGAAGWMAYSLHKTAMDGVLPAQTKALEYAGRALAFRVEQQQKPLQSLAMMLAGHMQESEHALEAMLKQPASMAQQFEQIQLANGKGQLLLNLQQQQVRPLHQLEEPLRESLKRVLAEGKPLTQALMRADDLGLQLEFHSVVPVRDTQGQLTGVLGGNFRVPLTVLFSLDAGATDVGSQLLLMDRELHLLAFSHQGQWQLPAAGAAVLPGALDPAWLKTAQLGAVSVQHHHQLWSAMPLPWAQWTLLKVSDVQEWVPRVSPKMMAWMSAVLLAVALVLGMLLCLIAYPLTALFRTAEWAERRGLMMELDSSVHGANWWQDLSDHDWGEVQTLRTALQALGSGYEVHGERERQLELQLQTLMDYVPVGLIVTHGAKVQRVGILAARVLGYQPREMQGLPVRALCMSDADCQDLLQRVHRALATYGQFDSEVCFLRKDSRPIWVRIHGRSMQRMNREWGQAATQVQEPYLVWELEDVTAQRQLREQSGWKAMHDPLTRLPNRTAFALRLKEWLQEYAAADCLQSLNAADAAARLPAQPMVHGIVLYVDLDHFSRVNRQGGREVGDEVLGHIARLIEATVRPHGWVARVGGDEFAILMAGVSREEGMRHAQMLCMAIQDWEGSYQGQRYMLSASIGMLLLDASYHNAASAFKGADMACYAAKRKGRNRVEVMTAAV